MIDLNELQIFAQLGKSQSFTAAARVLGTQKSAVSRALANLESRLEVKLVERTTRSVALTEAGELFLAQCLRVLEEAEQADVVISTLHRKPKGRLRVGAPVPYLRFVLGPILGEFLRMYPEMKLSMHIIQAPGISPDVDLDVAIRQGPLVDSGARVMPLQSVPLGLYASVGYAKQHGLPNTPSDLRDHCCINTNCGSRGEPSDFAKITLHKNDQSETVRVESRIALADPSLNLELALSDAGIALLSQVLARQAVSDGTLIRVLPEWEPERVQLFAVYASRLNSSPKVKAFLEFLKCHSPGC